MGSIYLTLMDNVDVLGLEGIVSKKSAISKNPANQNMNSLFLLGFLVPSFSLVEILIAAPMLP